MKKNIIIILIILFVLGCESYSDVYVELATDGTKISTPEMEYDSRDHEQAPSADEKALDDAIKSVQED